MADALVKALLPMVLAGPPAPREYPPSQMIGRQSEHKPGFVEDMTPMLIAALADIISTEGMSRSGFKESNPILPSVGGSHVPALGMASLLQALIYHKLGKKNPGLASALKTQQTASSGTLAGQNFALIGKNPRTSDERLSVWNGVR